MKTVWNWMRKTCINHRNLEYVYISYFIYIYKIRYLYFLYDLNKNIYYMNYICTHSCIYARTHLERKKTKPTIIIKLPRNTEKFKNHLITTTGAGKFKLPKTLYNRYIPMTFVKKIPFWMIFGAKKKQKSSHLKLYLQ